MNYEIHVRVLNQKSPPQKPSVIFHSLIVSSIYIVALIDLEVLRAIRQLKCMHINWCNRTLESLEPSNITYRYGK